MSDDGENYGNVLRFRPRSGYTESMPSTINPEGWTVQVFPSTDPRAMPDRFKLIATAPGGGAIIHRDKLTREQVENFSPEREWAVVLTNRRPLR